QKAKLRDFEGRAFVALGECYASTLFDDTGRGEKSMSAEDYFSKGIEIYRQIGNDAELARGLERLGKFRIERGDVKSGKKMLQESAGFSERRGRKAGERVGKGVDEPGGALGGRRLRSRSRCDRHWRRGRCRRWPGRETRGGPTADNCGRRNRRS